MQLTGKALNWDLPDPQLTPRGAQQCRDLRGYLNKNCPLAGEIEVIITSPMRRTIETTLLSFDPLVAGGVKVELDADWQGAFFSLLLRDSLIVHLN